MELCNAIDNFPLWLKVILALPGIDIVWVVYRLIKSIAKKNVLGIVLAVVLIIVGIPFLWLVDIICIALKGNVWWLD